MFPGKPLPARKSIKAIAKTQAGQGQALAGRRLGGVSKPSRAELETSEAPSGVVGQETNWGHVLMEQGSARALRVGREAGRSFETGSATNQQDIHITQLLSALFSHLEIRVQRATQHKECCIK